MDKEKFLKRTTSDPDDDRQAAISISVVVPTCGRPDLLNRCLGALIAQRHVAGYELIVVDDRPHENTRRIVESWKEKAEHARIAMRYIASPGPHGPAAARNFGWRAATASIIAFTDDDTVAPEAWLCNGLQAFASGEVDAIWGSIVMPLNREPTDYELDAKGLERAEFVTANCFCRRDVLEKIGGFDERYLFAWREDADLYFSLVAVGARVRHWPAAVMVHPIRPAKWGVSISQQKKILFDALLFKKHPELYRQKIRARPNWNYYLIAVSLLVALTGLLAGAVVPAAAAGVLWLLLTIRFCLKRLHCTIKTPSHIWEMAVTSSVIPLLSVFWRTVGSIKFRKLCL